MRTIQIRDVPDNVYEQLASSAKKNHRSVRGEILHMLESAYAGYPTATAEDLYRQISAVREEISQKYGVAPSSVSLIREDRDSR